jgi:metal-responsive CopG/Arc/MetJ family transcriptional regulator
MQSITINLPDELAQRLEIRMREAGFSSMPNYIIHLLKGCVGIEERYGSDERPFSVEDEEKVVDRLKSLGYID